MAEMGNGMQEAKLNTDRELWREVDSYYAPRLFVTAQCGIGIDVGGLVIVKPIREWHALVAALQGLQEGVKDVLQIVILDEAEDTPETVLLALRQKWQIRDEWEQHATEKVDALLKKNAALESALKEKEQTATSLKSSHDNWVRRANNAQAQVVALAQDKKELLESLERQRRLMSGKCIDCGAELDSPTKIGYCDKCFHKWLAEIDAARSSEQPRTTEIEKAER